MTSFGRIDMLFNNAGICAYGLAHELSEDEWDAMLDINLKGAWLVARRVIPHMIGQRTGVIINNSSVAGLRGMNRLSHYAASKWGLVGLTKSWAIELAPHGVRVVSIHPTGVNTPMNDGLAELEGLTPQEIAERSAGNLLPCRGSSPRTWRKRWCTSHRTEGAVRDGLAARARRGPADAVRRESCAGGRGSSIESRVKKLQSVGVWGSTRLLTLDARPVGSSVAFGSLDVAIGA